MKILLIFFFVFLLPSSSIALDAQDNGKGWISLGVPSYIHMGTKGDFYLNGTNQGSCANVRPQYFRMDMSKPYFKEFYSWMLYMQSKNKGLDCVVETGCGSNQVWVSYCRGRL